MSLQTPPLATDAEIDALADLEREVIYLRPLPVEDWNIDIDDDGAMVAVCPQCKGREVSCVTPERLECRECGHRDGQQYVRVGRTQDDPGEVLPVPYSDPDEER